MFSDKHVYIIPENDRFFFLHIDALINRGGIDPNDFCAVFISNDKDRMIDGYPGVNYYNSSLVDMSSLKRAKTITSLSLSNYNACFIRELIDLFPDVVEKYYIFLTDDEVDSWESIYLDNGELLESDSKSVNTDVISVLSSVKFFIGPEAALKHRIEKVLERRVTFIDSVCFFYILPLSEHCKISDSLIRDKNSIKRVWYQTKSIKGDFNSIGEFISLYKSFSKAFSDKVHFILFASRPKTCLYVYVCLLYLKYIKKMKAKVDIVNHTDKYSYIYQLQACDFLMLQPRGGASTARTLISLKRGMVCVLDGTMNEDGLKNSYKIPLIYGKDYQDIAQKAASNQFNIQYSYEKMYEAEQNSIETLKVLYS